MPVSRLFLRGARENVILTVLKALSFDHMINSITIIMTTC